METEATVTNTPHARAAQNRQKGTYVAPQHSPAELHAADLLRNAGWRVTEPPDPHAPCSHCGKPWNYNGSCHIGGCPLGADL